MGRGIDRAAVAASASLFVLLCAIDIVAGQETCTNVTVSGGGELAGDYVLTSESNYAGESEGHILQAIVYGDDSSRRALTQRDEEEGGGEGARRSLANDCTSQSWYLADTAAMVDGFPFYQAFDCAEHPADIDGETDWMLVTCDDCSEIVSVTIECTADSGESQADGGDGDDDDGMFTVGVIAGIAAGAGVVVLLLCAGLLCAARRKKKEKSENPKGNSTFADDSDHDARLKAAGPGGGAGPGGAAAGTAGFTANADSDANANASTSTSTTSRGIGFGRAKSRSKVMGRGSFKGDSKTAAVAGAAGVAGARGGSADVSRSSASGAPADVSRSSTVESDKKPTRLFPSGANAKSFKPGHQAVENASYEGMFASQGSGGGGAGGGSSSAGGAPGVGPRHDARHESRAMSMDVDTRKDSMSVAAAAAAARAAKARGGVEKAPPPPLGSVLHSGVVADGRRAGAGAGTGARTGARAGAGADAGGGITWSAGQDVYPRRAGHGGGGGGGHAAAAAFVVGEDSAAGSVYSAAGGQRFNRDDDDDDDDYYYDGDDGQPLQHTYNDECGESVPASSPGAYSMYSHYTAGGGAYRGGHSEAAWSDEGDEDGGAGAGSVSGAGSVGGRSRQHQRLRSAQAAMVIPAPNIPPTVVLEVTAGKGQSTAKMLSPAGHLARVDRNSDKQDDELGDFSRR